MQHLIPIYHSTHRPWYYYCWWKLSLNTYPVGVIKSEAMLLIYWKAIILYMVLA